MKENYDFYRIKYNKHIIFIKSGNFYLVLNDDALILNKIFNYKIKEVNHYIRVGFPLSSLNKVLEKIIDLQINYVVIDNVINKECFKKNKYCNYLNNTYDDLIYRINRINDILKMNINFSKIDSLLDCIENDLCKIS